MNNQKLRRPVSYWAPEFFYYGSDRPCWVHWSFSTEKRKCTQR